MEEEFQFSDNAGRNPSNPAIPLSQLHMLGLRDHQGGYTCRVEQRRRESWRDFHGFSLLSLLGSQEICREEGFWAYEGSCLLRLTANSCVEVRKPPAVEGRNNRKDLMCADEYSTFPLPEWKDHGHKVNSRKKKKSPRPEAAQVPHS